MGGTSEEAGGEEAPLLSPDYLFLGKERLLGLRDRGNRNLVSFVVSASLLMCWAALILFIINAGRWLKHEDGS